MSDAQELTWAEQMRAALLEVRPALLELSRVNRALGEAAKRAAEDAWRQMFAQVDRPAPVPVPDFDPPLDRGIEYGVRALVKAGIETYESCEGGEGHAYPEPTIRFHGDSSEGFRALAVALQYELPVSAVRRVWNIIDGEPTGPTWEMVFWRKLDRNVRGPFFRVVVNDEDNNG